MGSKKNMGMASGFQNVKTTGKARPGSLDAFYKKMQKNSPSKMKKAPKK